jgi:hypothetical protein
LAYGSLAYLLKDGDLLPKKKSHCWVGAYVGHYLAKTFNVPVIYNPLTTLISPEFHVVFDKLFTTLTAHPSTCDQASMRPCIIQHHGWTRMPSVIPRICTIFSKPSVTYQETQPATVTLPDTSTVTFSLYPAGDTAAHTTSTSA